MASSDVLQVNQHYLSKPPEESDAFGITQQKPKFPQYAVVSKRTESYKNWPEYLPLTPDALVEAGLVYTGVGDSVRCFYCGGGLRNWERGDNPWEEHARWYPSCPHVMLVKGQQFVNLVKNGQKPEQDGPKAPEVVSAPPSPGDDLINSPAAQACIQMGYSQDQVQRAIKRFIQISDGSTNFKGKDLGEILIDMEDEEHVMEVTTQSQIVEQNVADSRPSVVMEPEPQMEDEEIENVEELYEENRRLKENQMCKICLDDVANVIFLPCGHMVSCPQCAPALVKCPICRLSVKGVGDSVRCFYCGGGLRNWERGDNPWEEHARWYPSCPHVMLVKGQQFVNLVKNGQKPEQDGPKAPEVVSAPPSPGDDLINSPAAQACIQMGYSQDQVQRAIERFIQISDGSTNFKGKDLGEILIDMEDEEHVMEVTTQSQIVEQNVADSRPSVVMEPEPQMEDEEIENVEELYEENRRLKENQMCKICLDDVANVIFLPCGHMVSCPQCAPALVKCPICRLSVKGIVKAYFATN